MLLAANPFISSYIQSDWFGKSIFWGLFLLSVATWSILLHKIWLFAQVRKASREFIALFSESEPLALQFCRPLKSSSPFEVPHPFFEIYKVFKQYTLKLINRNHSFAPESETTLSEADLGLLEMQVQTAVASHAKQLEQNLFILSTAVSLAPFLGLLGTVWGILLTFSQLQTKGISMSSASMLSGLSLALATTVFGLIVAIPALVGYNVLKSRGRAYAREMEAFSHLLLTSIELHYRKPNHAEKTPALSS